MECIIMIWYNQISRASSTIIKKSAFDMRENNAKLIIAG